MESSSKSSNVEVRGNILLNNLANSFIAPTKYLMLEKTGGQIFTANQTDQPVQWATEVIDVGDWFNVATSATTATVPDDVFFIDIFLNLNWTTGDEEAVNHARILRNSTDFFTSGCVQNSVLYSNDSPYPASSYVHQIDLHLAPVTPGDTIRVEVDTFQDTAINPTIQAGASAMFIVAWPFKEGV